MNRADENNKEEEIFTAPYKGRERENFRTQLTQLCCCINEIARAINNNCERIGDIIKIGAKARVGDDEASAAQITMTFHENRP